MSCRQGFFLKPTDYISTTKNSLAAKALIYNSSNTLSHSLYRTIPTSRLTNLSNPQNISQTLALDHKLVISGGSQLSGHVPISGSKNSALAVLAATLCCSGTSLLHRIPNISDTETMVSILQSLGARIDVRDGDVEVDTVGLCSTEPCPDAVRRIRAGFFVLGPLIARFGEATVALPGGCDIGARPVDLYLRGLRAMGAIVELRHGKVVARTANGRRLVGGSFHLDYPSVGATETLMMAASLADGVTVLLNVAREPEVTDLAQFLIASGASVEGAGTDKLVINGRKRLCGSEFSVIPDRIEAGTFMISAAITRSCVLMSPVIPCHLTSVANKLLAAGCKITQKGSHILEVSAVPATIGGDLRSVGFKTCPYPGFPTDLQPQFTALLTTCNGLSIVEESVFEGRMRHVKELQKFGSRFQVCGSSAVVYGRAPKSVLRGSCVVATDLRNGAALVLAGMAAEGITEVSGVAHIDRGYENLEMKLHCLGADVKRELGSSVTCPC